MRHREGARRAKPFLIALLVLLPTLSAVGFVRMKLAVLALRVGPLHADPKLVGHQLALDAWRHNILMLYLSLLIGAFVAGQLRNWLERRRLRKAMIDA
jgi:adenylate cyclase